MMLEDIFLIAFRVLKVCCLASPLLYIKLKKKKLASKWGLISVMVGVLLLMVLTIIQGLLFADLCCDDFDLESLEEIEI